MNKLAQFIADCHWAYYNVEPLVSDKTYDLLIEDLKGMLT